MRSCRAPNKLNTVNTEAMRAAQSCAVTPKVSGMMRGKTPRRAADIEAPGTPGTAAATALTIDDGGGPARPAPPRGQPEPDGHGDHAAQRCAQTLKTLCPQSKPDLRGLHRRAASLSLTATAPRCTAVRGSPAPRSSEGNSGCC